MAEWYGQVNACMMDEYSNSGLVFSKTYKSETYIPGEEFTFY